MPCAITLHAARAVCTVPAEANTAPRRNKFGRGHRALSAHAEGLGSRHTLLALLSMLLLQEHEATQAQHRRDAEWQRRCEEKRRQDEAKRRALQEAREAAYRLSHKYCASGR